MSRKGSDNPRRAQTRAWIAGLGFSAIALTVSLLAPGHSRWLYPAAGVVGGLLAAYVYSLVTSKRK